MRRNSNDLIFAELFSAIWTVFRKKKIQGTQTPSALRAPAKRDPYYKSGNNTGQPQIHKHAVIFSD